MEPPASRPTIRTVAQHAGVSKSLVSLVLQGSPKVGPAKRAAVEAAIEELGYRPSLVARTLSTRRTRVIGIVLNDLRNPWFVDCFEGFATAASERGYRTLLADDRLDGVTHGSLVGTLLELHVDGLVLMGTMTPSPSLRSAAEATPTVVAASRDFSDPHLDVVACDDDAGARMAVDHLVTLGHRDIAHVAGSTGAVPAIRRRAFAEQMAVHGLDRAARVLASDMTERGGYEAGRRLLERPDRPRAVFAANDVMAIGVMSAARELGIRVPEELAVVGYDNTALAGLGLVDLTSIDIANRQVGTLAAEALISRIDEPRTDGRERLVRPHLVIRGSTTPAAPAHHS